MKSFVMDAKILGMKRHDRVEAKQEAWVATGLRDMGLSVWLRRKPPTTGDNDHDEQEGQDVDQSVHYGRDGSAQRVARGPDRDPSSLTAARERIAPVPRETRTRTPS